jgi:hypothetical protein
MRFLADLNIESQVIRRLREKNQDVLSAAENFVGAPDEIVLAASTSQNRVLITNDKDFAELAYLQGKASAGIILARRKRLLLAVGAAEEGDGLGGSGVGVAFDARPGAALGVPEVALQAIGVVGVVGEHPAEEDVRASLASVLDEALPQVHVVPAHPLRHEAASAHAS